ncbi:MAG TPA: LysE family translocator [Candidatus Limnocylindria bacterium]|nr:LysE family translocator [Candidatus Limnocylindria bacterium]
MSLIFDGQFWVGVGLLALLTLSPGATTALVVAVAAGHGRRASFVTTLGIGTGIVVHSAASGLGLSVVLAASPEAFTLLKTAGAIYLAYLGVRALVRSSRRQAAAAAMPSNRAFYMRGLLTNLLNPQVAIFYLTFLPQFINPNEQVLAKSLVFGLSHACIAITWFAAYAYGVTSLATRVQAAKPWIERVSGLVLIGFAVRLLQLSR